MLQFLPLKPIQWKWMWAKTCQWIVLSTPKLYQILTIITHTPNHTQTLSAAYLAGSFEHVSFTPYLGMIIPIDIRLVKPATKCRICWAHVEISPQRDIREKCVGNHGKPLEWGGKNQRESWKFPMTNPLKLKPTLKQPHVSLFGPRNCLSRRVSAELSSMLLDRSDPTCHRGRKWPKTNLNMYSKSSMCTPNMSLFLCPCMFAS
jgi:hypothetical protein